MKKFSIRSAASQLKVSEMYLRKMLSQGKIISEKEYISEKVWRHTISEDELKRFSEKTSVKTSREDSRNKFVIYLTSKEEEKVRKLLKSNELVEVESLLARANKKI